MYDDILVSYQKMDLQDFVNQSLTIDILNPIEILKTLNCVMLP